MDLVTVLLQDPEPLPEWLRQPSPGFDRTSFFESRTVYYPGSGNDGQPVKLCARAHAAHAFIHVDYGVSMPDIRDRVHGVGDPGFLGYQVEHEEEVEESVLRPRGWIPHIELSELKKGADRFADVRPFGLYVVFRRDEDHDDAHGPERFAVLFVGGDGHAAYDALYCQADETPPPYLAVVQDHGFGGNYDSFGAGGLLERIARRCGVYPNRLLVGARGRSYEPWAGYRDSGATPEPGGMLAIPRRIFVREEESANRTPKPNLFKYATKELSQDAVICWLIEWSGTQAEDESEQDLRKLGCAFVEALLARHGATLTGGVHSTEIHQQNLGIDVLARVRDHETSHVLLIEDKTDTGQHSVQLERYRQSVLNGDSALKKVHEPSVHLVFLKTGNQSLYKDRRIERDSGYKVFARRDFLDVLDRYPGDHPIVTDFREHLRRLETASTGYRHWSRDDDRRNWTWSAWEGFFRFLEDSLLEDGLLEDSLVPDWGYVSNPRGGFLGFWWHWVDTRAGDALYLQLEIEPGELERQKLCFKVERGDHSTLPGRTGQVPPASRSPPSFASVRVAPAPPLERGGGLSVVDDDVGDGGRAYGVVGVRAAPVEQLEVRRGASAPLEPRPCDVSHDRSPHSCCLRACPAVARQRRCRVRTNLGAGYLGPDPLPIVTSGGCALISASVRNHALCPRMDCAHQAVQPVSHPFDSLFEFP